MCRKLRTYKKAGALAKGILGILKAFSNGVLSVLLNLLNSPSSYIYLKIKFLIKKTKTVGRFPTSSERYHFDQHYKLPLVNDMPSFVHEKAYIPHPQPNTVPRLPHTAYSKLPPSHRKPQTTHHLLQTTHGKTQTQHHLLQTTHGQTQTQHCLLPTTHRKPQTQHHLLPTTHRKTQTQHHLLQTAHGKTQTQHHLLPTANCLLHTGHLLFPLLFFLATLIANAQLFPVQVTPQLIPPYSLKLSDYQTATNEKLIVNILLTDTQDAGRQVGLKMFIEGQGLSIRSQDFVVGAPPIFLDGGFNLRLTNLDLGPYFALNNLVGISPQQYNRPLPDGRYDFCFEVYDRFSGQRLSRRQCTPVFLLLNDPPFLNLPGRGDLVTATDPQNILFNWTPRHLNATGVRYEFTLKELWDTGIDPQAAFLAAPPLHQETTFAPTLLYGPANLQLLQGKTYAWQVRAVATDGINEAAVFRNNGYSEIYHFRYQGRCDPPRYALSQALNARTVEVTWQPSAHLRYALQFRKKGSDGEWFARYAYGNAHTLHDLEAGTAYEFRVGGECSPNGGFSFGPAQTFTTPTEEATAHYNCGVPPEVEIANQDPLPNLGVNEVFTAGDFPVTVKEVVGRGNGTFSGWGHISVPYLADTRIRVIFNNIQINTDFQLIRGMVETDYDANESAIVDLDQTIEDIANLAETVIEALNLDISKATKERIEEVVDVLLTQISQEDLPEEIRGKIVEAASELKKAKEKYEEALNNNDEEGIKTAKRAFKNAQKELGEAHENVEEYREAVADLLKKAIIELYREGRDSEGILEEYSQIKTSQEIEPSEDIYVLDKIHLDQNTSVANEPSSIQERLNELELKIGVYLFAKILSQENNGEKLVFFVEEAKKMNRDFYALIAELSRENKPEREKIDALKLLLKEQIVEILITKSEK